ncbi:MAG: MoxR family ATPase [Kofleriaceae bacterium]|nr:MoxR family ATPase [Kofleriaceae bacterium]
MLIGSEEVAAVQEKVASASIFVDKVFQEVGRVVVGQRYVIERMIIGLLCGGHCLIEGVPGLAKTLAVKTLAQTFSASFQRIQFTPDLLPADIVGTTIYNMQTSQFTRKRGPVFANLVLADEINRAPAKVQSALLEAMEEAQVTIGGESEALPDPFMVLATQNPIEQQGTYVLPEAQLDRFMLMIRVDYPSASEERAIMDRMTGERPVASIVSSVEEILAARRILSEIHVSDSIRDYIVAIVHASRNPSEVGLAELSSLIDVGASPRASIYLLMAARAHAFLQHRGYVTPEDVKAIGLDVLGHRISLGYEAQAEGVRTDEIVRRLFESIAVP